MTADTGKGRKLLVYGFWHTYTCQTPTKSLKKIIKGNETWPKLSSNHHIGNPLPHCNQKMHVKSSIADCFLWLWRCCESWIHTARPDY